MTDTHSTYIHKGLITGGRGPHDTRYIKLAPSAIINLQSVTVGIENYFTIKQVNGIFFPPEVFFYNRKSSSNPIISLIFLLRHTARHEVYIFIQLVNISRNFHDYMELAKEIDPMCFYEMG